MPQKYGKGLKALPGFSADPAAVRAARDKIEAANEKRRSKRMKRRFLAEPEELATLDALQKLPLEERLAAAEGLLIARRFRKRKIA